MPFDFAIFDMINGLAGRFAPLDLLGRLLAVYGLLAALMLAAAPAWLLPEPATRRQYLRALLMTLLLCALLAAFQHLVTEHVLHHEIRSRPANARWTTLLISPTTAFSFPAWPALLAFALAVPTYRVWRGMGRMMLALGTGIAIALVFVGANYPLDALTGAFVGLVAGHVAWLRSLPPAQRSLRHLAPVSGALAVWLGVLAFTLQPANLADIAIVPTRQFTTHLPLHDPATLHALAEIAPADRVEGDIAAMRQHAQAGWLRVTLAAPRTYGEVEQLTRRLANATFSHLPTLDILTISIYARFQRDGGEKVGTVFTVTLARASWPRGGYPPAQPLPGYKYVHPRYFRAQ